MNYKSINDLSIDLLNNLQMIPHDIDLVVGVPRSGLLVANMIALYLNMQITDVDGLLSDHIISFGNTKTHLSSGIIRHISDCKKILVVEDTVYTGESLLSVKKRIAESQLSCEVLYFAAYVSPGKESLVDIFLETLPGPRFFEWNLFHSSILEYSCVDIDGILCADPTEDENDDGDCYKDFLAHAAPKIIPTRRIKYLVSSRLEKYRAETEKWLEENKVSYDKLFLLDATAKERKEKGMHVGFKASVYSQTDCLLFIESSPNQAQAIYNKTGKPVYCAANNMLYNGNDSLQGEFNVKKAKTLRSYLAKSTVLKMLYRRIKRLFHHT